MFLKIKIWLYIYLCKQYYGFAKISTKVIYAQAAHETGNFTSAIFKENNNLFGMRQAKIRKNYATGTARGHATFKNLFNSVRDYFERQKNFGIDSGNDNAFMDSTVKSNYAEDVQYKTKWLQTIQTLKFPVSTSVILLLFFFLLVSIWVIRYVWNYIWNSANTTNRFGSSSKKQKTTKVKFSKA